MKKKITILPGDGIGKEVTASGKKVLEQIADCFGHEFVFDYATIGHEAIEATGNPLPDETLKKLKKMPTPFYSVQLGIQNMIMILRLK